MKRVITGIFCLSLFSGYSYDGNNLKNTKVAPTEVLTPDLEPNTTTSQDQENLAKKRRTLRIIAISVAIIAGIYSATKPK